MYEKGKGLLLAFLRVPSRPAAPEGSSSSLRVFRASPSYLRYRLIGWALRSVWLVVIAVIALTSLARGLDRAEAHGGLRMLLGGIEMIGIAGLLVTIVVSFLTLRLDFEMRWYMVTDRSLRIREGVWHVHEMTMTFANIQNVSISQGPLQRFFGIADLRVQSAGGGGGGGQQQESGQGKGIRDLHVGYFRGVDDAPAIRDLVLRRLRQLRDGGLGDHDDEPSDALPSDVPGQIWDADMVSALRQVQAESSLLRASAERVLPG